MGTVVGFGLLLLAFLALLLIARLVMYLTSPARSDHEGSVSMIGGLWLDSLKLSWPLARYELSQDALVVSSVERRGRRHLEPVVVERAAVAGIRCHRTPFGSGFRVQGTGVGSLYLWPGRYQLWLEQWKAFGWPTGEIGWTEDGSTSARVGTEGDQGRRQTDPTEVLAAGSRWTLAAARVYPVVLATLIASGFAVVGADPVIGTIGAVIWGVSTYMLWWHILFRLEIHGCLMIGRSGARVTQVDAHDLVEVIVPRAWLFSSLAVGTISAAGVTYRVCFVGRGHRSQWDRLVAAVTPCTDRVVIVGSDSRRES